MFRNIYYSTKTSTVHLWEQVNGKNFYDRIHWVPSVFVRSDNGKQKTIDGNNAKKITFDKYGDYYSYNKDPNKFLLEDNTIPAVQFLSEKYQDIPDDKIDPPDLRIYYIDIESHRENSGFPSISKAEDLITVISIYDNIDKKVITFGLFEYDGKLKDKKWFNYHKCKNEKVLLISFFNYLYKNPCDVISGWAVNNFDIPYIINRTKKIFGENTDLYKKMSPIKIVNQWISNNKDMKIDIAGITILDYLDLYKWYSPHNLERHTLDFVSKYEIGKGKLDYSEYGDLKELYKKNWNLYVEYNVIDAYRVGQIGKKLGYIRLVQSLSLLCRVPMKFYHTMTTLIEGLLLTYYRRNNLCAPHFYGGKQEAFEAAYVKEPYKEKFEWVMDLDIISSYPSHIITLNMSPETFYGRILGFTEDEVMDYTYNRNFPEFDLMNKGEIKKIDGRKLKIFNKAIEKKMVSIAPCGSVFTTNKIGVIADVQRQIFNKRRSIKKKMNKMKLSLSEIEKSDRKAVENQIDRTFNLQWALKILLNATFGSTSVPYSRYFNLHISEAITSCGRRTIKAGEKYTNELLNNPNEEIMNIIEKIKKELEHE